MTDSTTAESALDNPADNESFNQSPTPEALASLLQTAQQLSSDIRTGLFQVDVHSLEPLVQLVNRLQESKVCLDSMLSALTTDQSHPAMATVVNADWDIQQLDQHNISSSTTPTDIAPQQHYASQGQDAVVEAIKKMSTLFQ